MGTLNSRKENLTDYKYSDYESRKAFEKILRDIDRRQAASSKRDIGIEHPYQSPTGTDPIDHPTRKPDSELLAQLPEGGYTVVQPARGGKERTGARAHRGVIQEDEHVDHELLIGMLEEELGYSFEEARLAFDPLAYVEEVPNYYAIRDRMVEIHEAGGNISLLADVLGINRGTLATAIWRQKQRRKGNV